MKNNSLFLLVAAVFAIVSCGAADLYAQKKVSQYRNGIYYSGQQRPVQAQPVEEYAEELPAADVRIPVWIPVRIPIRTAPVRSAVP